MANLVRAELTNAREHRGDRIVRVAGAGQAGADQRLEDDQVLAGAQRAEKHRALDDLSRARIGDRLTIRPTSCRAVDPIDHVVADVERVGAGGQDLGAERVNEARRVERSAPPADAVAQGRSNRLGCARIDVKDDRLFDRRAGRRRVHLLKPETTCDIADDRRTERRRKVDLLEPDRVAVGVVPRDVASGGQRN